MRNQLSSQSRESRYRYMRPNTQPTEIRYVTKQFSQDRYNDQSKTNKRIDSQTESFYEHVPATKSNPSQRQYIAEEKSTYEKPSLPYYVVPVLYVPQKVLSSEEIRPASSFQEKQTINTVQKQQKQMREQNVKPIDVDNIPCVACESQRKNTNQRRLNYRYEEALVNNMKLNPLHEGYFNTSYTQSSTSLIEEIEYEDPSPNYVQSVPQKKYTRSPYQEYGYTYKKKANPNRISRSDAYRNFMQQQKRYANVKQQTETAARKADIRLYWNSQRNCYEGVDNSPVTDVLNMGFCEDFSEESDDEKYFRTDSPQTYRVRPQDQTDRQINDNIYDNMYYYSKGNTKYVTIRPHKDKSDQAEIQQETIQNANSEISQYNCTVRRSVDLQDYSSFSPYEDIQKLSSHSQNRQYTEYVAPYESTLTCEKAAPVVDKICDFVGDTMTCETIELPEENITDNLTAAPAEKVLEETESIAVMRKNRDVKESQTTFEEKIIYSTYIPNDETIKDSKSTQTVDATTTTVAQGCQTDRTMTIFTTYPTPYIEKIREEVNLAVKEKSREYSPSPTRLRRQLSPAKHHFTEGKKSILKSQEIQKPNSNQCTATLPSRLPKCKRKKVKPPFSPP